MWKVLEFISIETAEETYKAELTQQAHDDAIKSSVNDEQGGLSKRNIRSLFSFSLGVLWYL